MGIKQPFTNTYIEVTHSVSSKKFLYFICNINQQNMALPTYLESTYLRCFKIYKKNYDEQDYTLWKIFIKAIKIEVLL